MARPKKKHTRATVVASSSSSSRTKQKSGILGSLATKAGQSATKTTAGLLVSNPLASGVAIIIAIILLIVITNYAVVTFVDKIMNMWMWALALFISVGLRPSRTTSLILSSVIVGGVFWIFETWSLYQQVADVCAIPILGTLICGAFTMNWILNLIIYIIVAFVMVVALSFLSRLLINAWTE